MGSSVGGVGVIDKAVLLFDALEHGPSSLAELVEATGLSRATAHRLAVALESHGLVGRDDEGRFVLGSRLVSLGRAAARGHSLVEVADAAMAELRDATGESVQLYVREGDRRVCVAALESPHGLRTIVPVGARLPLGVGSGGRLLLPDAEVPTRGWVDSVGEREPGVASVSAPVLDPEGRILAVVSVSGPVERTTRAPGRRYGAAVVAAARRIELAARTV
ncbi:MAG: IclR family transcriptional regulator [Acidimicrobiales bacterium]|nr:IclR family transcriptional regulator [Acidimicrobiales bacterium]